MSGIGSLLLMGMLGCAPGLRYPGPLSSLHPPPPPEAPAPEPALEPAPDAVADSEPINIPASALPPRRQQLPAPSAGPQGATVRGSEVVSSGLRLLSNTRMSVRGEVYRHDCIGMVEAAYDQALRLDLTSSIKHLYAQAQVLGLRHARPFPSPGDVAFFDDSYDKNRNGRRDDPFTHVTLVERVDEDGTIHMIHLGGKGKPVTRKRMNLLHPDQRRSPEGKSWNEHLRSPKDRDGGPELTGQLFIGFGSFWAASEEDLRRAAQIVRQNMID